MKLQRETIENMMAMTQAKTFKPVIEKLRRLVIDSRCNPKVVTAILSSDPMLTAVVVGRANFAGQHSRNPGQTATAIGTLGISGLAGLLEEIEPFTGPQASALAPCWSHASATSTLACLIAKHCAGKLERDVDVDVVATAGLIHDLGSILTLMQLGDRYHQAAKRLLAGEGPLHHLLTDTIGISPQGVGLLYARSHGIPSILRSVIAHHSSPHRCSEYPGLAHVVHLARNLAIACGHAAGLDIFVDTIQDKTLELLGLNMGNIRSVLKEYKILSDDLNCYETYLAGAF